MITKKETSIYYETIDFDGCTVNCKIKKEQLTGNYKEVNGKIFIEYNARFRFLWFEWFKPVWIHEDVIYFIDTTYYSCKDDQ